jgi:hypothetical protein
MTFLKNYCHHSVDWLLSAMHRQFAHLPSASPNNRARSTGPISIGGCVRSIENYIQKEHAN